ncbi:MAG: hypothetical protein ACERKD_08480 [Prolixibacteraceae bacterium]
MKYREGIIFTLLFHILVFIILNISQFRNKMEFNENEIIIDFPENRLDETPPAPVKTVPNNTIGEIKTNIASNRAADNAKTILNDDFQQELERAQNLVKDVSKQLSKDIPTIKDLKMPVNKSEGMNPDSILKKLYSGESNVEYFLKDRYHIELPIPVYLTQYGGTVKVNIRVDIKGNVIEANPIVTQNMKEQMLSYAKTAALRTKFNSFSGNQIQEGYIIYHFIAQ